MLIPIRFWLLNCCYICSYLPCLPLILADLSLLSNDPTFQSGPALFCLTSQALAQTSEQEGWLSFESCNLILIFSFFFSPLFFSLSLSFSSPTISYIVLNSVSFLLCLSYQSLLLLSLWYPILFFDTSLFYPLCCYSFFIHPQCWALSYQSHRAIPPVLPLYVLTALFFLF